MAMKGYEKWAAEDARGCTSLGDFNEPKSADVESVRHLAYIRGFKFGREKVASMVESFGGSKNEHLALLIRAIGEADVPPPGTIPEEQE